MINCECYNWRKKIEEMKFKFIIADANPVTLINNNVVVHVRLSFVAEARGFNDRFTIIIQSTLEQNASQNKNLKSYRSYRKFLLPIQRYMPLCSTVCAKLKLWQENKSISPFTLTRIINRRHNTIFWGCGTR